MQINLLALDRTPLYLFLCRGPRHFSFLDSILNEFPRFQPFSRPLDVILLRDPSRFSRANQHEGRNRSSDPKGMRVAPADLRSVAVERAWGMWKDAGDAHSSIHDPRRKGGKLGYPGRNVVLSTARSPSDSPFDIVQPPLNYSNILASDTNAPIFNDDTSVIRSSKCRDKEKNEISFMKPFTFKLFTYK